MKILTKTDEQLVLQHKPIIQWCGLIQILAFVSYLWYSVILGTNVATKLSCNRFSENQVDCKLERLNTVASIETLKIFSPQAAKIVKEEVRSNYYHYQVLILTSSSEYSLLPPISSGDEEPKNQQVADQINQFIANKKNTLEITQEQWKAVSLNIAFALITTLILTPSIAYCVIAPMTKCTFDKKVNKLIIKRKRIFNQKTFEYPLNNIEQVHIQPYFKSHFQVARLALMLTSQEEVILHHNYLSNKDVRDLLESIKSFI
ncbi:hypothetical protein CAL7716_104050 (plasmid) [Calothrix sp. PCC 7716]|nr:hypothetical protein CAL7716_104050 [Calothrix sp. PCC 7716]